MEIQFTQSLRQFSQDLRDPGRAHASGVTQTEDSVSESDVVVSERRDRMFAEQAEDRRQHGAGARFADETNGAKFFFHRDWQRVAKDCRVQVQMRVAVPITWRETERAELRKLRPDFLPQRRGERWTEGVAQSGARG